MRIALALAAFAAASGAQAAGPALTPADRVQALAWMAGSWISEQDGTVTRETWLPPLDGAMAGAGQTTRPGKPPSFEHARITAEPSGVAYTTIVRGQPPVTFMLLPGPAGEAVFENKAHDFPQRVIYRRCGEGLCARIEGTTQGKARHFEWRYTRIR